jgi:dipeptidyl aminopeptidase/acylaminoacyl peptidase
VDEGPFTNVQPTYSNLSYGEYPRNVLDFWKAFSVRPTPLVVFIHGGGFQSFGKERIMHDDVRQFLSAGISVAATNYRYV